jgi:ATP-dependent RNA helicase DeaD
MNNFEQFGLPSTLITSLEGLSITSPTPIQQETIPLALSGLDVLASAHTGTGKTIAYLIPLIMKMFESQQHRSLILAPTRELAMQVHQALNKILGGRSPFKSALLIGGAPMFKQFVELRKKPQIIVGTPGRINDHLERGTLDLNLTQFLVIDEADRMLDMGFGIQLDRIAEYLPTTRQTLMFSATLSTNIERLSKKYLKDPKRVSIDTSLQQAPKIQQETLHIKTMEKMSHLLEQLKQREGSIIVFVKTRRKAESLSQELREYGHNTEAMHGDLNQRRRERVIHSFRIGKSRILVATDVAARGLDIPHVMHVINYDLPECPEDYVHRIGRTGRAEAEGFALSFISPEDGFRWREISRVINPESAHNEPAYNTDRPKKRFNGYSKRMGENRNRGERDSAFKFKPKKRPFKHPHAPSQARTKAPVA